MCLCTIFEPSLILKILLAHWTMYMMIFSDKQLYSNIIFNKNWLKLPKFYYFLIIIVLRGNNNYTINMWFTMMLKMNKNSLIFILIKDERLYAEKAFLHLLQTYTNTLTFEVFSIEIIPCGLFPSTLKLLRVVKLSITIAIKSLKNYGRICK